MKDKVKITDNQVTYYSPVMCYTESYLNKQIADVKAEQDKNWKWIYVGAGGFAVFTGLTVWTWSKVINESNQAEDAYILYLRANKYNNQVYYQSHKDHVNKANEFRVWRAISIVGALGFAGVATYYYMTMPGVEEIEKLERMKVCVMPVGNNNWYGSVQFSLRF